MMKRVPISLLCFFLLTATASVQVLWDSSSKSRSNQAADDGIPSLIYVSREKSPTQHHHFKAGAMNVLVRIRTSSVFTVRSATDEWRGAS